MKKTNLLKITTFIFAASLLAGVHGIAGSAVVSAEETLPSCEIVGENLSLEDNIHILYAVDFQNITTTDETGLLVWTTPQESYVYATANSVLSESVTLKKDAVTYLTFSYNKLSAKEMTDTVYASAYVKREGAYYYSAVEKYSILEYAYDKLGKTESEETSDVNLKNLLNGMLSYGALAQTYFNYRTDSLANDAFTYVRVENAHFADGFDYGFFKTGTTVNVYPNDGYCLSSSATDFTEDENGNITLTVHEDKLIDCDSIVKERSSSGLNFDYNYGVEWVIGLGSCTATKIVIPSTYNGYPVRRIYSSAFSGNAAKNITSITIPDSITEIDSDAFQHCSSLVNIKVSKDNPNFKSINGNLYSKDGTTLLQYAPGKTNTSFSIFDGVVSIGKYAFLNCKNLTSLVIPDSVTSVGNYALSGCNSLTNIYIEDIVAWNNISGLSGIMSHGANEKNLYLKNKLLTDLVIPDGVTSIGYDAFRGCSSLTSVTIPNSVTSIKDSAFRGCSGLTSVTIPKSVTEIDQGAFINTGITKFIVSSDNMAYKAIDGNIYSKNGNTFVLCAPQKSIVNIADGVKSIDAYAFYNCERLTSVTIPDSVYNISGNAFAGCKNLTSVTIPDGVQWLLSKTFSNCSSLKSIVLPKSLTSIDSETFYDCTELTTVYYQGTVSEWKISIGSYNGNLKNATRYYYSETQPTTEGNYWHYDINCNIVVW